MKEPFPDWLSASLLLLLALAAAPGAVLILKVLWTARTSGIFPSRDFTIRRSEQPFRFRLALLVNGLAALIVALLFWFAVLGLFQVVFRPVS